MTLSGQIRNPNPIEIIVINYYNSDIDAFIINIILFYLCVIGNNIIIFQWPLDAKAYLFNNNNNKKKIFFNIMSVECVIIIIVFVLYECG